MMDPRSQECFGHYLYGAGYFARDDNTLGLLQGKKGAADHFCLTCPRRKSCEANQQVRVRQDQPAMVERYERAISAAVDRGMSELLAAVALAKAGGNPYYNDATANFGRGHADRGAVAGPLVAPKAEADVG